MRTRLATFFAFVVAFSGVYSLGAETEVSEEEAGAFMEEFSKLIEGIDGFGIFTHNTGLALPMFIPGLGVAWGLFSAWSTGVAFSAISTLTPELANFPPLAILYLSPFGIMELTAYSLAVSRSFLLGWAIMRYKTLPRPQLKPTCVEVGVVVALLLAGGYLEFYMIQSVTEFGAGMPELDLS